MKTHLLRASVLAVCLGAAMSANAQPTVAPGQGYQPAMPPVIDQSAPSTAPTYDRGTPSAYPSQSMGGQQMPLRQGTWADQSPPSGIDATAYSQCHGLSASDYWDCVNSHDGGGGQ